MLAASALALSFSLAAAPEDGRAAVAPYKKALKEALVAALEVSAQNAVDVCRVQAPALARAHSHDGVKVGRTALKLRNPAANAAPTWVKPLMEALAKAPKGSQEPMVVKLPNGQTGYAEPIWVQAPCLTCHGTQVDPALAAKLDAAYPNDAARGFAVGDFRGVFWAEVPTR